MDGSTATPDITFGTQDGPLPKKFRFRGVEMIFAWPHYWGALTFRAVLDGNAHA